MPTWHQNRTTQIAMPAAPQEIPIIDEKELELQVNYPWAVFINMISSLTSLLAGTYKVIFLQYIKRRGGNCYHLIVPLKWNFFSLCSQWQRWAYVFYSDNVVHLKSHESTALGTLLIVRNLFEWLPINNLFLMLPFLPPLQPFKLTLECFHCRVLCTPSL